MHCFIRKVCLRNNITGFSYQRLITLNLLLNRKTRLFHHHKFLENVKGLKTNLVLVILLFERVRLYEFYNEFTRETCLDCFQKLKNTQMYFFLLSFFFLLKCMTFYLLSSLLTNQICCKMLMYHLAITFAVL